jgi:predicted naringenin-chalcone synthase
MSAPALLSLSCASPLLRASQGDILRHALTTTPAPTQQAHARVQDIYRNAGILTRGIASDLDCQHEASQSSSEPAHVLAAALAALRNESDPHAPASTAQRMRAYQPRAGALARKASAAALLESGVQPASITHLVTATCTGFGAPGWEAALPAQLNLSPHVLRTHIGFMGCHAAINALRVAHAFAACSSSNRVLVCCAEVCSLHEQPDAHAPNHTHRAVANALFADGAAACVVGTPESHATLDPTRTPKPKLATLRASAATVFPKTSDHMSWHIGDHGFAMTLSRALPRAIRERAGPWLQEWLASCDLSLAQIAGWAIHPGGPHVLDACEAALGLSRQSLESSREVLAQHGNMSSPTSLFVLAQELARLRAKAQHGPIVMLSFGPGVAAEAMLIDA